MSSELPIWLVGDGQFDALLFDFVQNTVHTQ